jgi:hypothetical protein
VQFLVLLGSVDHFDDWEAADEALRSRYFADYKAFADAVRERGRIVVGDALTRPESARTLRPGQPRMVTEGPFAETVEQIGGFYVVDLPDLDTAVEIAGLLPREYAVEVRPTLGIVV